MLPDLTLPASLAGLLAVFAPCFTAPSWATFCGLVTGFATQTGRRTVCGMLVGAGLARLWPHDRAHYFFASAAWSADTVGLVLAVLVVSRLVPAGQPVSVVVDDTLFKRSGRKVWGVSWFHDGSAKTPKKVGLGNNWVIAGIVVTLPFIDRPVCLPVLARLVQKEHHVGLPVVAVLADGRRPGRRAARAPHRGERRRRIRRRRATSPARVRHLDYQAA